MSPNFSISYRVVPKHPEAHLFEVTCTIQSPGSEGQIVSLPAWIPGSYMIRDFARNIVSLHGHCGDEAIAVRKLDKQTWQFGRCEGPLIIHYEVYAWDLSVRAAHLDSTHGYFNGTSLFLMVQGYEQHACGVEILPPQGNQYQRWQLATTLPRNGAPPYGFGLYMASDYDELIDHPVEMGTFTLASFQAGGLPHDVVITGRHRADTKRLCSDLQRICQTHIDMFGELPAMDRYLFMIMAVGEGYGGLEHRSSTSLLCSRNDLPLSGEAKITEEYRTLLGLCSHEYFHTWNVKRIKPEAFAPYDLTREVYTRQLWAFEGITSYYDDLALVRCGLITAEEYLELLAQTITRVWRGSGRFKQSVADSSFDAWSKFYKQDENAPNGIVSYYTKGALIALALDLTLRREIKHKISLDDVMRALWSRFGRTGVGVPEGSVEKTAAEISKLNLNDFFNRYVTGTEDPDLKSVLHDMAIEFNLRAGENADDKGGKPAQGEPHPTLGARLATDSGGAKVTHVYDAGPAQRAGISAGDVLIAVNGIRIVKSNAEKLLASYPINSQVHLYAFRRDELMEFDVLLTEPVKDTCVLSLDAKAEKACLKHRSKWLNHH